MTTEITIAHLARQIAQLQLDLARLIRLVEQRPASDAAEPIAIPAVEVARLLSISRNRVYQLNYAGVLSGFRLDGRSQLRFLLSEVRAVAERMAEERANT